MPNRPIHIGAVVLHQQRVLFVRQTASHSLGPVWTIPWGVLDPDENPSDAALRETFEEAGVSARVAGLVATQMLPPPWQGTLALVFLCHHVSGTPRPDGMETSEARYLDASELGEIAGEFEPWSLWLARRVLVGHTSVLASHEGNPFGPEGFIAASLEGA
jgi:ADP-ribose pyrophosphatase YjhB (NUDIX family)